jgi:hypothetical protein
MTDYVQMYAILSWNHQKALNYSRINEGALSAPLRVFQVLSDGHGMLESVRVIDPSLFLVNSGATVSKVSWKCQSPWDYHVKVKDSL